MVPWRPNLVNAIIVRIRGLHDESRGPGYRSVRETRGERRGTMTPCGDPRTIRSGPISYWLRGEVPPADPPLLGDTTADVVVVGAGFTGLWTALALTDTAPGLRVAVLEAETVAFGASGRNGGFCEASLTHGLANGIRHFADELERPRARRPRQPARPDGLHPDHAIDCDLEETGTLTARRPALPGRRAPRVGGRGGRLRRGPRVHGPGGGPGRDPLPALSWPDSTGRRVATSCSTRSSCAAACARRPRARRPHPRAHPGRAPGARRRRGPGHDRGRRDGPGRPGRHRHVGLLGLVPAPAPDLRAGLRLRARLRAAHARRARVDRLAAAAGPVRRATTSSTTSG